MLANEYYILSDDPTTFATADARLYDLTYQGRQVSLGFAGEMIQYAGQWYRSGVLGPDDHWSLGFTAIEWDETGAFKIARPSVLA
jgi:hypothetical protein